MDTSVEWNVCGSISDDGMRLLFKCSTKQCNYSSADEKEFRLHVVKENHSRNCCYCFKQLSNAKTLASHITENHSQSIFQCGYCFFRTRLYDLIIHHYHREHEDYGQPFFHVLLDSLSDVTSSGTASSKLNLQWLPQLCCGERDCDFKTHFYDCLREHISTAHVNDASTHNFVCKLCALDQYCSLDIEDYISHFVTHNIYPYHCYVCATTSDSAKEIFCHSMQNHPGLDACWLNRYAYNDEAISGYFITSGILLDNMIKAVNSSVNAENQTEVGIFLKNVSCDQRASMDIVLSDTLQVNKTQTDLNIITNSEIMSIRPEHVKRKERKRFRKALDVASVLQQKLETFPSVETNDSFTVLEANNTICSNKINVPPLVGETICDINVDGHIIQPISTDKLELIVDTLDKPDQLMTISHDKHFDKMSDKEYPSGESKEGNCNTLFDKMSDKEYPSGESKERNCNTSDEVEVLNASVGQMDTTLPYGDTADQCNWTVGYGEILSFWSRQKEAEKKLERDLGYLLLYYYENCPSALELAKDCIQNKTFLKKKNARPSSTVTEDNTSTSPVPESRCLYGNTAHGKSIHIISPKKSLHQLRNEDNIIITRSNLCEESSDKEKQNVESIQQIFTCKVDRCPYQCKYISAYVEHLMIEHGNLLKYPCGLCRHSSPSLQDLHCHFEAAHSQHISDDCSKSKMVDIPNENIFNNPIACSCGFTTKVRCNLVNHIRKHEASNDFYTLKTQSSNGHNRRGKESINTARKSSTRSKNKSSRVVTVSPINQKSEHKEKLHGRERSSTFSLPVDSNKSILKDNYTVTPKDVTPFHNDQVNSLAHISTTENSSMLDIEHSVSSDRSAVIYSSSVLDTKPKGEKEKCSASTMENISQVRDEVCSKTNILKPERKKELLDALHSQCQYRFIPQQYLFSCCIPLCSFVAENNRQLLSHFLENHIECNTFTCRSCVFSFQKAKQYVNHVTYHGPALFKCSMCVGFYGKSLSQVERHCISSHLGMHNWGTENVIEIRDLHVDEPIEINFLNEEYKKLHKEQSECGINPTTIDGVYTSSSANARLSNSDTTDLVMPAMEYSDISTSQQDISIVSSNNSCATELTELKECIPDVAIGDEDRRELSEDLFYCTECPSSLCAECPSTFLYEKDLRDHLYLKFGYCYYGCSSCSETFPSRSMANIHFKQNHKGKIASPVKLSTNKSLERKVSKIIQKSKRSVAITHECDQMEYEVLPVKNNKTMYRCLHCKYCSRFAQRMQAHTYRIHGVWHPFKCGYCSYVSALKTDLHRHLSQDHPNLRRKFKVRTFADIQSNERYNTQEDSHSTEADLTSATLRNQATPKAKSVLGRQYLKCSKIISRRVPLVKLINKKYNYLPSVLLKRLQPQKPERLPLLHVSPTKRRHKQLSGFKQNAGGRIKNRRTLHLEQSHTLSSQHTMKNQSQLRCYVNVAVGQRTMNVPLTEVIPYINFDVNVILTPFELYFSQNML